jgi:O-antigen/teichoic acid export membrane protein
VSAPFPARHWWTSWEERVRGEVVLVLMGRLANAVAGTVFVLLTARHLGPTGRGIIALAFTLAWATTSVADLGTSTSGRIGLLAPDSGITERDVLSLTVALIPLQAVLSVVVVVVLSVTSLHLGVRFAVAVIALSVATMMFNSAVCLVYGLRRYGEVVTAEVSLAVLQIACLVGLLWTGRLTTTSAVVAMTIGPFLGAVWLAHATGALSLDLLVRHNSQWRKLVIDGLSPMAGNFSLFLALRADRLIIAVVAGTHSLGVFAIALAIPETLRILPKAVSQVIADRVRSGVDQVAMARRHARRFVVLHSLLLTIAFLVGWLLLPVVFGEGFRDARDVLLIVVVAEAVLTVHLMQQALLVGFGHPSGIGIPQVAGATVMVALDLVLIPAWGIQGAAWACLLGYSTLAATSTVWTSRELGRQVL